MKTAITVSPVGARRFARWALRFDEPLPDARAALARMGWVQVDPINVCGRMHDLILRSRVAGYREGDLMRAVHGSDGAARAGFEHFIPGGVIAALPFEAWPHLQHRMAERRALAKGWGGRLSADEATLATRVLDEIASRGPTTSDAIAHEGSATTAWGGRARAVKTVLDKLFIHGRVLITARREMRRVYDLPERVLPREVLDAPAVTADESARWWVLHRLRQRRLAKLSPAEAALAGDGARTVTVEGVGTLSVLAEDLDALIDCDRAAQRGDAVDATPRLVAPLDPLVYDRRVLRALWGYAYTWEVYTPPEKRVRGYYALPVLVGDALVGHVDPAADRGAGRLRVVGKKLPRGVSAKGAVTELAGFLGLKG